MVLANLEVADKLGLPFFLRFRCSPPLVALAATVNNEADGERVSAEGPQKVVADKGYHSNAVLRKLSENGVRSYIPEPTRGRRKWPGKAVEQKAVYRN